MNLMFLLIHIVIALSSVGYTTYLYFSPSRRHFYTAYALVGSTLASGTYLVISTRSPLLQSCLTGLIYIGVVLFGIATAYRHAASESKTIDKNR